LKEEGKISEKRSKAFEALQAYAESSETDRWPTKRELYEWCQQNLDREDFPWYEFGNFKPRITELTPESDATDVELVEYKEEKREQDSERSDRKAHPVKILSFQSTLSSEEGEAAELKEEEPGQESEQSRESSVEEDVEEIEIPYSVEDGSEVRMAGPEEAIAQTDDLDSVKEMLEAKGLLDEYQADIDAIREHDELQSNSTGEKDSSEPVEEEGLVKKDGQKYVFEPGDDPSEVSGDDSSSDGDVEDDSEEEGEQKLLFDKGEIVG